MTEEAGSCPSPEELKAQYLKFEEENEERQRVVQEILAELDDPAPAEGKRTA
jgi:hypothetical protein